MSSSPVKITKTKRARKPACQKKEAIKSIRALLKAVSDSPDCITLDKLQSAAAMLTVLVPTPRLAIDVPSTPKRDVIKTPKKH